MDLETVIQSEVSQKEENKDRTSARINGVELHGTDAHPQQDVVFTLALSIHSFWSYFSTDLQEHVGHLLAWEVHLSVSYLFAFSYCSWGSQGQNTKVVYHSLLQWTTFCLNSPP